MGDELEPNSDYSYSLFTCSIADTVRRILPKDSKPDWDYCYKPVVTQGRIQGSEDEAIEKLERIAIRNNFRAIAEVRENYVWDPKEQCIRHYIRGIGIEPLYAGMSATERDKLRDELEESK